MWYSTVVHSVLIPAGILLIDCLLLKRIGSGLIQSGMLLPTHVAAQNLQVFAAIITVSISGPAIRSLMVEHM